MMLQVQIKLYFGPGLDQSQTVEYVGFEQSNIYSLHSSTGLYVMKMIIIKFIFITRKSTITMFFTKGKHKTINR